MIMKRSLGNEIGPTDLDSVLVLLLIFSKVSQMIHVFFLKDASSPKDFWTTSTSKLDLCNECRRLLFLSGQTDLTRFVKSQWSACPQQSEAIMCFHFTSSSSTESHRTRLSSGISLSRQNEAIRGWKTGRHWPTRQPIPKSSTMRIRRRVVFWDNL